MKKCNICTDGDTLQCTVCGIEVCEDCDADDKIPECDEHPSGAHTLRQNEIKNNKLIVGYKEYDLAGDVDLSESTITSLPENLKVVGWLDLSVTAITSLPEGLEVGDSIFVYGAKIKRENVPSHLLDKCVW